MEQVKYLISANCDPSPYVWDKIAEVEAINHVTALEKALGSDRALFLEPISGRLFLYKDRLNPDVWYKIETQLEANETPRSSVK